MILLVSDGQSVGLIKRIIRVCLISAIRFRSSWFKQTDENNLEEESNN